MSSTTPKSSTPKSKSKSSVYVSQVTPSPALPITLASTVSNGNAQNGCLTSSGSYEADRGNVSVKVAGNGVVNGRSLENGRSSQETNELERDRKMSVKGEEKGGAAGSEEGASRDSGKGEKGGASCGAEGAVPKINKSKRERGRRKGGEEGRREGVWGRRDNTKLAPILTCWIA